MKKIFQIGFLTLIIVLLWIGYLQYFKVPEPTLNNIEKIDIIPNGNKIYFDIYTQKSSNCKEVISLLDITPEIFDDELYSPSCAKVEKNLIRVTYTQNIKI